MSLSEKVQEIQKKSYPKETDNLIKIIAEQSALYDEMKEIGLTKKQDYNIPLYFNNGPPTFLVR